MTGCHIGRFAVGISSSRRTAVSGSTACGYIGGRAARVRIVRSAVPDVGLATISACHGIPASVVPPLDRQSSRGGRSGYDDLFWTQRTEVVPVILSRPRRDRQSRTVPAARRDEPLELQGGQTTRCSSFIRAQRKTRGVGRGHGCSTDVGAARSEDGASAPAHDDAPRFIWATEQRYRSSFLDPLRRRGRDDSNSVGRTRDQMTQRGRPLNRFARATFGYRRAIGEFQRRHSSITRLVENLRPQG